ncbi:MAG: 2-hydroxyacyl-CoA dehydratase [Chloroflexi bacterium]|nr:2-hydroxyacyl-CoA dehydratase [Chloroflexota bacterium]
MTIEVKPKRAINRLQSMYALRAQADKIYEVAQKAKEEGKQVAWYMVGAPTPILDAMGIESVYPENFGGTSAATGDAVTFLEKAGAEGLPTHLCGYAQNCFGYAARMAELGGEVPPEAPRGGMPKPDLLVSTGGGCDARYKWFQSLGRYLDAPIYTLETSHVAAGRDFQGRDSIREDVHEREVQYQLTELRQFVDFVEHTLPVKLDIDKLDSDLNIQIAKDKCWWEVNELRKARPGPMHSRDFWSSMHGSLFRATNPEEVRGLYAAMYAEVKERIEKRIAGINYEERYRLSFSELPPWHSLGFFDKLAERGWNFVIETNYHPPRPIDVSWVKDPLERFVRYRNPGVCAQIDFDYSPEEAAEIKAEITRQGYSSRLAARNVIEYQCDGAMLHVLLTCRSTSAHLFLKRKHYMEAAKVPCMAVDGDIVDLSLFNPEETLRKAEAFEETMDYYKMVRKEAGMAW